GGAHVDLPRLQPGGRHAPRAILRQLSPGTSEPLRAGRRGRQPPLRARRDLAGAARPRRHGRCIMSTAVAVVTGATRGIGFALAEELLREGMIVYAIGVDQTRLADAAARLAHANLHVRRLDVANLEAFEELLREIDVRHGRLDWMVNNAGVLAGGELADMN